MSGTALGVGDRMMAGKPLPPRSFYAIREDILRTETSVKQMYKVTLNVIKFMEEKKQTRVREA